ncbi:magnesium-translocating P-type ATPase [Bosea sp. CS1GBMeth4]|uniref:magnesium-translocating P-type ATPase n=1 Tax=Bosea sp. CS1GBMeth4 TaxID=1892849 RepID=UPI001647B708|nr:magnesium-translocating P-type ATPase [Bosea sp. CS1GBMeth4]
MAASQQPAPDEPSAFWRDGAEAALAKLGSTPAGLGSAEAAERLRRDGPNVAVASLRRGLVAKLARRLGDPLVAILLIAAAVAGATGDWRSLAIIVVIVLASILLDIAQETQAENTVDALRRSVAVHASVRRDGRAVEVPVRAIVPGDVVALRAGDLVPADGIVLSGRGALADEAALTGEPFPVEKRAGRSGAALPGEAFEALFAGTSLVAGEALMLVVATGTATRLGAIACSMQLRQPPTAFERGVRDLGMLILRLTGFLVLFVLLTQLARQGLSFESFLFAVALAVGLTPELLPMVTTVTLARGALRMARRQVVVKRLSAIHDLGAMDVLCTDKTGTLTEARIAHVASFGCDGSDSARVTGLIRLNSRFCGGLRNNLDAAILAGAAADEPGWSLVAELPFDFQRRRASVLLARDDARELIVKGAPEALLALCEACELPDGRLAPLDAARRREIGALIEARGAQGLRLLGVARRPMPADVASVRREDETGLVFVGCAAFLDPPKASAGAAIAELAVAGVRVKVISGDAGPVVRHLAESLNLPGRGLLSGEEVAALNDAALAARVSRTDLFVRITPEQKARIVIALRRAGHTVGFIGDGINDAPAIHAADVGLSVDGGTEVAREAAAIVLLAPDLAVLAQGIAEGRRTYANIMKYVRMGTSSNFGNMLSMALSAMVLPFLPLTPLQILINNMLYDLSEVGIPFDEADRQDLARPRHWDTGGILRFTLVMGPLSSLFDLATFALLLGVFQVDVAAFRTAWFVESILTQVLVIFVIRTAARPWRSRPDRLLVATSLGALALALALALTPLGRPLGFVPLPPPLLLAIVAIAAVYLGLAEAAKPLAMKAAGRRRGAGHGRHDPRRGQHRS